MLPVQPLRARPRGSIPSGAIGPTSNIFLHITQQPVSMSSEKLKFGTKVIHSGIEPDPSTGAIMTPIFQTSTYVQQSVGQHKGYAYGRSQNPTRSALEAQLTALENGVDAVCYSSGLAAADAVLRLLAPGDEVIATNDLYGGSYRLMTTIFANIGVKFRFVDLQKASDIHKHVGQQTKMIWLETPTNPLLNIVDITAVSEAVKGKGIITVVDNTFASPYLQNPLDLGADLALHSATKYLGGHSDVVHGAVVSADQGLADRLRYIQNAVGAVPGPQDCFLVLRGIKTLHVRVQRACENAAAIANSLLRIDKVANVYYPGLQTHPNHNIATRQMRDYGAMVSFDLKDDNKAAANNVLIKNKLFSLAESLGGVESLIGHPATMTHASIPKAERKKIGLTDSLIRLSVGIEDVTDLIADLEQALL